MAHKPAFKRVLVKLSGEALKGDQTTGGLDAATLDGLALRFKAVRELGTEVAVVVGGGNFFRGLGSNATGIDRTTGDQIGMLATVMNGLALRDTFISAGLKCSVFNAFEVNGFCEKFSVRKAKEAMSRGDIVVLAGGTGHPFFTTDTTAALRACELEAEAVLKATQVNGVFNADPQTIENAKRYECITFDDVIAQRLAVMDQTAFSLCRDNRIPIIIFKLQASSALIEVVCGNYSQGTLVGGNETITEATS